MVGKKINQAYQAVERHSRQHIYQRPYILPLLGLLIGVGIVLGVVYTRHGQSLKVSDYHVVYLFDKGRKQVLNSKASTVRKLLSESSIKLNKADVVEPGLKTKIVEDNYRVNIYRARPVTIIDKGQKIISLTAQRSPRVVAQKAGLKVLPEYEVVFTQGNLKNNTIGEEVIVRRSQTVFLNVYGKALKVHTHAKNVAGLLTEKGFRLAEGDSVKPGLTTKISAKLTIFFLPKKN